MPAFFSTILIVLSSLVQFGVIDYYNDYNIGYYIFLISQGLFWFLFSNLVRQRKLVRFSITADSNCNELGFPKNCIFSLH